MANRKDNHPSLQSRNTPGQPNSYPQLEVAPAMSKEAKWLSDYPELSENLNIVFWHGSEELIPRNELEKAARLIDDLGLRLTAIDAFKLYPDGKLQPSMDNDFPSPNKVSCEEYVSSNLPSVEDWITHFGVMLK